MTTQQLMSIAKFGDIADQIAAGAATVDRERSLPVASLELLSGVGAGALPSLRSTVALEPPRRGRGQLRGCGVGVCIDRNGLPHAHDHGGDTIGTLGFSERGTGAHYYAPETHRGAPRQHGQDLGPQELCHLGCARQPVLGSRADRHVRRTGLLRRCARRQRRQVRWRMAGAGHGRQQQHRAGALRSRSRSRSENREAGQRSRSRLPRRCPLFQRCRPTAQRARRTHVPDLLRFVERYAPDPATAVENNRIRRLRAAGFAAAEATPL